MITYLDRKGDQKRPIWESLPEDHRPRFHLHLLLELLVFFEWFFTTHTLDSTFQDAFLWYLQKFSCHFHSPCVRDQKKDLQSGSCIYKIVKIWIHIFNLQKCFLCINLIFDIVFVFFPQEVFVKPRSIKYPVWLSFLFVFHLQDIGNHSGEKSTAVENRLKFKILNKRQKQKQMTNDKWRKIWSANQ